MPARAKPRKARQPFFVVDRADFERRLAEARAGLSPHAVRRVSEGQFLEPATVGTEVWAYSARQAVFFRMVRETGMTTDGLFSRFVGVPRDEWKAMVHSPIVTLVPAARATRTPASARPDPEEFLEARRVADEVVAELAQEPLVIRPDETGCGCIPTREVVRPVIDRPDRPPARRRAPKPPAPTTQLDLFRAAV